MPATSLRPAHQNGPLILVNGNRIQYSPAVDNTHPARRLHTLRTPGVQHSAARAGAARCDPSPAWDDAFTATGNYVDAAAYPKERLGCHNHCVSTAGDAVVVGWAGLKCGK